MAVSIVGRAGTRTAGSTIHGRVVGAALGLVAAAVLAGCGSGAGPSTPHVSSSGSAASSAGGSGLGVELRQAFSGVPFRCPFDTSEVARIVGLPMEVNPAAAGSTSQCGFV